MVPCLAALMLGCNRYDLFRLAGYEQESFNNKADVLFVIDNSPTMSAISADMAVNFSGFITEIDSFEQSLSYEGLPDAVTNFIGAVQNRSQYVDYQFAIVTTDVPTDAGALVGPVLTRGDEQVPERFVENLACEATCFDGTNPLPTDPDYTCGDPLGSFLSEEYMDCACGGNYLGNCGTADEEGIEAVFLAMCRAVENPPAACFEDVIVGEDDRTQEYPALIDQGDKRSNEGLLRDGSNLVVVVVSDEGDGSRRQWDDAPDEEKEIPDEYTALFAQFRHRMTWVYVGQDFDADGDVRCPSAGTDWGAVRYHYLAYTTGGTFIPLFDESCDPIPFDQTLTRIGDLLTNLLTEFPLQSVPIPGTLVVLVDGRTVDEAAITGQDQFGLDVWSDGWSYRNEDNTVVFHGAAVPNYDANVEVYYKPVDGMPRDLPF